MDLLAGQTQLVFAGVPGIIAHARTGRLRPLGVSTTKRLAVLPEVSTISEAGVPGYEATQWYGVLAPVGTPKAIIDKLNKELVTWVQTKEVADRFGAMGSEPASSTPGEFMALIKSEIERWAPVVRGAGLRAD
ncbi:MAG: hypothetical protein A3G24_12120 [Betaproteobacteria bacterium RIFCSPLOWO2_12_FULL_62_13]|nr:MAG: hypothetical protein A3G24_12120 [Betaproteobacteria bacterium RIFCSPLOWO2_12_FULL_62_13]